MSLEQGTHSSVRRIFFFSTYSESTLTKTLAGGLMAGLARFPHSVESAVMLGSISASYMIEQFGLPATGVEGIWNGTSPEARFAEMKSRVSPYFPHERIIVKSATSQT